MPNFIHTESQEKNWHDAKRAAAQSKGKSVEQLKGTDWGLVTHIYQNMTKSQGFPDIAKADLDANLGTSFGPSKKSQTTDPMKVGTQATVKMPKPKKIPDSLEKPSKFFKNEDQKPDKKRSIDKLEEFLNNVRSKR